MAALSSTMFAHWVREDEGMLSFARRSILNELSLVVCALVVLPPLACPQRPVVPAAHPPVAPVHVSPPPVFHSQVIQTPITETTKCKSIASLGIAINGLTMT